MTNQIVRGHMGKRNLRGTMRKSGYVGDQNGVLVIKTFPKFNKKKSRFLILISYGKSGSFIIYLLLEVKWFGTDSVRQFY